MPICPSNYGTMRSSPSAVPSALEGVSSMSFRMRCRPSWPIKLREALKFWTPRFAPAKKKTSCRLYTFYASDVKWTTSLFSKQFCWILTVLRAQRGLTDPPDFSINGLWVHWCIISTRGQPQIPCRSTQNRNSGPRGPIRFTQVGYTLMFCLLKPPCSPGFRQKFECLRIGYSIPKKRDD